MDSEGADKQGAYVQGLEQLARDGRLRRVRTFDASNAFSARSPANPKLFCSNDYLGLSRHPAVVDAACKEAMRSGVGATASPLVCGRRHVHDELERELARLKGTDSALLFSSGYLAAMGVVQALANYPGRGKRWFLFDRLTHACLIDAIQLHAPRHWKTYPHGDADAVRTMLAEWPADLPPPVIVTEGVFSMDGTVGPLPALAKLVEETGATLLVDDAHGTGSLGPWGSGTLAALKVQTSRNIVVMGTLSKALGSQGGFVCSNSDFREWMINHSRSFIFDTALSPMAAAAALAALGVLRSEPRRQEQLAQGVKLLRFELQRAPVGGLMPNLPELPTPICPLIVGRDQRALLAARRLEEQGIVVPAIRPPTVPAGTSRLRITLSAEHTHEDVLGLVKALEVALA